MKTFIGVCAIFTLHVEVTSTVTLGGVLEKASARSPHSPDAFRSDSTLGALRFMRRRAASQQKESQQQGPLKEAQKGPNYDSKKAQKAAETVGQEDSKKAASEKTAQESEKPDGKGVAVGPIESIGNAIEDADKDAGKTIDKALDGDFKAPDFKAPKAPGNPIEDLGNAVEDADKAAGKAVAEGLKAPSEEKPEKPEKAAAEEKTQESEEPEAKEVSSVPGCANSPKGWKDKRNQDCEDYAEGEWCTRFGRYGDGWLNEWGTFEDVATDGVPATRVCCVCGGGVREGPGPAPGPAPYDAAAPAPASAPTPAGPLFGTKVNRPLQSQGFHGKLVAHEDGETMTSDWGREFGPSAGHRDIRKICADHPDNEWCLMHGYFDKDAAAHLTTGAVVVALLAFIGLQ